MATVIKLKRSETPSAVPSSGNLEAGELAMNVTDGKFYTKTSGGVVKEVGGGGSVTLQDATDNSAITTNVNVEPPSAVTFTFTFNTVVELLLEIYNACITDFADPPEVYKLADELSISLKVKAAFLNELAIF